MSSTIPWYAQVRLQAVLLFAFAFALYANTLGHDFTVDDAIVITENVLVQQGVAGIGDIFSYDTFYGFFQDEGKANLVAGGRYRPLTLALFAVEQQISPGPFISHLFNVLWYGALVVLVYGFVRELAPGKGWLAVAVAALFAAHPVHTEAVANIKGRDEIVALFFAAGAAWAVLRAVRLRSWAWAFLGAGSLVLGCLGKETAFTFLGVIPVLAVLLGGGPQAGASKAGWHWGALRWCGPVALAGVGYLIVRGMVLPDASGAPILELMNNTFVRVENGAFVEIPTGERVATGFYGLGLYLWKSFLPFHLVHDYYPTAIPLQTWGAAGPWLGLLSHLALAGLGLWATRRHPLVTLGVVIYLAGISVASNIPFSIGTLLSERFLFFPTLGWALAIGYGFWRWARGGAALPKYLCTGVLALFAVLTVLRNPDWKDNYTLFTTDVRKQPDSAKLRNAAAGARTDRYQQLSEAAQATSKGLLTAAITDATAAIAIHPNYRNAYLIRGNANLLLEQFEAAITDYNRALAIEPSYTQAEDNLVIALTAAGRNAGEVRGDLPAALNYLRRAEQLRPLDFETLRLLGVASGISGQGDRALDYFARAVAVRPNDADAHWNHGTALYQLGRNQEAEAAFGRARALEPGIDGRRAN